MVNNNIPNLKLGYKMCVIIHLPYVQPVQDFNTNIGNSK